MAEMGAVIEPPPVTPDVTTTPAEAAVANVTDAKTEIDPNDPDLAEAHQILPQPTDAPEVQKRKASDVLIDVFGKMFAEHQQQSMTPLGYSQEIFARFLAALNPSAQKAFMTMARAMNIAQRNNQPPPTPTAA